MTIVAALVKYNPCVVYARRGIACPIFLRGKATSCAKHLGACNTPEYDGWFKDVLAGKTKCFYPLRIRLLEIPGAFLLIYHAQKRTILGEAKITKATSENNAHYYWFDQFLLYPSSVKLEAIQTDPRLAKMSRRGKWTIIYLSESTLEEIRQLSKLEIGSRERLRREAELTKRKVEEYGFFTQRAARFQLSEERKKLLKSGVEPEVLEKAGQIFLKARKKRLTHGRSERIAFYVSLYLANRSCRVPKKLHQIQEMGGIDQGHFKSTLKLLLHEFEIDLPLLDPKEWVIYYSRRLGVPSGTVCIALELVNRIKTRRNLRYRSPSTISATALYVACLRTNQGVVQRNIAEVFGVSAASIRNLSRLL